MNKYIFLIVFLCMGGAASAQYTLKQLINDAEESANAGNHAGAMQCYKMAIEQDRDNADLWYKYGNAALNQNACGESEKAFSYLIDSLSNNEYPDAFYKLGQALYRNGEYERAQNYFNIYTSEYGGNDPRITKLANQAKKSLAWAMKQEGGNEEYTVEKAGGGVNTGDSEHGPALLDGELYYASYRDWGIGEKKCGTTKIMRNRDVANTALKSRTSFNNDLIHTHSPAFSPDGTKLYYSVCENTATGKIRCDLYMAPVDNMNVGDGVALSGVNGAYTTTNPSVSADGTLYFASDRPGGSGGLDIYMASVSDNGTVSGVSAMGDINTDGDDDTPFIANDGKLYFSSNGRVGFGGYDIFVYDGGEITNLGSEVNTSQHDRYFIMNADNTMGYLSSNRPESMELGGDNSTCCFDLYKVIVETCTIDLLAMVRDCSADEDLNGANLTVTNNATGEVVYSDSRAASHKYPVEFDCDDAYTITASKDGYTTASVVVGPMSSKRGVQKVEETLCLTPARLDVTTFVDNCSKPTPANVTLFNVTDGTQESCSSDNTCSFPLAMGKQYRLVTSKGGYVSDVQEFNTNNLSSVLTKRACLERSQVEACKRIVPVRLYFDNDYPNPRSRATTTSESYSSLYNSYYPKKSEFIRKYGSAVGGKVRESVSGDIASFFDNDLAGGYNQMNSFLDCLLKSLQAGQTANVFLRGYASPLAKGDYNEALTSRRVQSVRNEFSSWRGGVLRQYLNNGQLKITERAFGETLSVSGVSDNPNNRRLSHYSPEASRERRVEIDEIKFNN